MPGTHPHRELAKVTHVARVGPLLEQRDHGRVERERRPARSCLTEEVAEQRDDVLAAFPERRQPHGDGGQSVVEVAAEPAGVALGAQVAVRRRQQPEGGALPARAADRLVGALLDDAQQRGLQVGGQLADLVEEERAAVGHLEGAGPGGARAGERALHVPEELAARQRRDDRRAVQQHELAAPGACVELVHEAGHDLLPRARLPRQQHRRRGEAGDLDDLAQHAPPAARGPQRDAPDLLRLDDGVHRRPPLHTDQQLLDARRDENDIVGTALQQPPRVAASTGCQRDKHPAAGRDGPDHVLGVRDIAGDEDDTGLGGVAGGTLVQTPATKLGDDLVG